MANQNIRVPRQGVTANSKRIARAVDDQSWQEFRVSLKGLSTRQKLDKLAAYYSEYHKPSSSDPEWEETVEIRIDNYLKALARGGQLHEGVSLKKALEGGGIRKLPIKKG